MKDQLLFGSRSIREILLAILIVVGILQIGDSTLELLDGIRSYRNAEEILLINDLFDGLFDTAQNLAYERGRTNVVLRNQGIISESNRAFLAKRRHQSEQSVRSVIEKATTKYPEQVADLENGLVQVRSLRARIDREFEIPRAQRDPSLPDAWFAEMSLMLGRIDNVLAFLGNTGNDPEGMHIRYSDLKRHALQFRDVVGRENSHIAVAVSSGVPLDRRKLDEITRLRSQADLLWSALVRGGNIINSSEIIQALNSVQEDFFTRHRAFENAVIEASSRGRKYPVEAERYLASGIRALDFIDRLMDQATRESQKYASGLRSNASWKLCAFAAQTAFVLLLMGFSVFIIHHRIMRPLKEISASVKNLRDGNLHAPITPLHYNDEYGHLSDILASFRQSLLEKQRISAELNESRQRLANIINFLPDATFVIDNDKKVIAWNIAMEEMTGIKKEDILGQGDHVYTVPFYGERRPQLLDLIDHDDEVLASRYKNIQRKGHTLYAEAFAPALYGGQGAYFWATGAPLFDASGNRIGAIESIRDITEQKRAQEDAARNHALLTAAVQQSPAGILIADAPDVRIRMANSAALGIRGFSSSPLVDIPAELHPQHWQVYHPDGSPFSPEELPLTRTIFEGIMCHNVEAIIRRADGEDRWVLANSSPIRNADGDVVAGLVLFADITDRKKAEENLRKSEERLHALFDSIDDFVFIKDPARRYVLMNDFFVKRFSIDRSEFLGKTDAEIECFENKAATRSTVSDTDARVLGGESVEYEITHRVRGITLTFSVHKTPVRDAHGAVIGICGVSRDVTERKRVEEALRESELFLKETQQIARLGGWKANPYTDYLKWSEMVYEIVEAPREYSPGLAEGLKYYPPEYIPVLRGNIANCLATGNPFLVEVEVITHNGNRRWTEVRGLAPVIEGERSYVVGTLQDITERKLAEETRRELEERLQRSEKMEALGLLAGGVAHDLNNVLGILVGYSELLAEDLDKTSPLRTHVDYIRLGGERAAAIVQDLLTLARRGVQTREIIDLNTVLKEFRASPDFEKLRSFHPNVTIETSLASGLLNIKGSPVHLRKTVMNLVSNAAEAMPEGGLITIRTANEYLDRPVAGYDDVQEGDYVVLSIADTGEGISPADMKRIFEPFYTKKVMGRSGTGLGLSVVWGTVKDHSGYVIVQSKEGAGTVFTLYFPVTREEASREQASTPLAAYLGNGESILVVDDVQGQRDLAVQMLKKLCYRVDSVASGEEALDYLKKSRADLLVLDMIMDPGMDGLDTYREILKLHPKQKVIIVSGFSESDRVRQAQALGAGTYVRKPYVLETLGLAVRKEMGKPAS